MVQALAVQSALKPLADLGLWSVRVAGSLRAFGLIVGGTCRFLALSVGLAQVLKVYQQSRPQAKFKTRDSFVLTVIGVQEAHDVIGVLNAGMRPSLSTVLSWPTDPILWFSGDGHG